MEHEQKALRRFNMWAHDVKKWYKKQQQSSKYKTFA